MNNYVSNQEMANYLNMALNSEMVKDIIIKCSSCEEASKIFSKLGNILEKYYVSTLDNSLKGVEMVCQIFVNKYYSCDDFDDYYVDFIVNRCFELGGFEHEMTFDDKLKIIELISIRNRNNLFYTHCFPGSLYDTVLTGGLDISSELFKDELELLERYAKTPFKHGKLCYCEFSESSLSYATGNIPERINYAIGGLKQIHDGESKYNLYIRSLRENLEFLKERGKITDELFIKLYEAGKKIIDFYCLNKNSCVALFRENLNLLQDESGFVMTKIVIDIRQLRGTFIGEKIKKLIEKCKKDPTNAGSILEDGIQQLEKFDPRLRSVVVEMVNTGLREYMKTIALRNYLHGGNANGYEINSGKLLPADFSIVRCSCPIDLWQDNRNINCTRTESEKNSKEGQRVPLISTLRDFVGVMKEMEKASRMEGGFDRIENVVFDKYNIFIYFYEGCPLFPNNYLLGEENGNYLISRFSRSSLIGRCISKIVDDILNDSQFSIDSIIGEYKTTSEYDADIYEDVDNLKDDTIFWYANKLFNNYGSDIQEEMIRKQAIMGDVVSIRLEGKCVVNNTIMVPRSIIMDKHNDAPYNYLYFEILEEQKSRKMTGKKV